MIEFPKTIKKKLLYIYIYMHVDDTSMLEYIADRFKIGGVSVGSRFSSFSHEKK